MINMKKFLLFSVFIPLILSAQVGGINPPPPNQLEAGPVGPPAPGEPTNLDNTLLLLLVSVLICTFVFLFFKKNNIGKI